MASRSRITTDLITCLICNQVTVDPRMLPCIHAFCLKCLESRGAKENRNPGEQMPCPACHSLFSIPAAGFTAIKIDLFVDKLKRFTEIFIPSECEACSDSDNDSTETQFARNFCVQCQQKLCECCSKTHRKSRLYMNHRLFDLDNQEMHNELAQQLVTVYCEKHKEEHLKLYCVPCKQVLCTTCYIETHQTHERKSVSDVASQFRDLIRAELGRLETPLTKLSEDKETLDKENEEITRNVNKIRNEILKREDEVKKEEGKYKVNEKTRTEFDARLVRLRSLNRYCEEIIQRGSDSDVCTAAQRLISRGEDLLEEYRTRAIAWHPQSMILYSRETDICEFTSSGGRNIIDRIQDDDEQQVEALSPTDFEILKLQKRIFEQDVKITKEKTIVDNLCKVNDKLKNELSRKTEESKIQEKVISSRNAQLCAARSETTKQKSTVVELIQNLEKERAGLQLLNVQRDALSKEVQNLKLTQSTEKKRWLSEETKLREKIKDLQQTLERTKQSTEKTEKELKEEIVNFRIQLHVQHVVVHHLSSCVNDFERKEFKWKVNENKLNKQIQELENVFAPEEYSRGARNLASILYTQRPAEVDYEQASFSSVIRRKYATRGNITGIAVTKGRLFVVSQSSSSIETFDSKTFDCFDLFRVEGLVDPVDIKGASTGYLYILDGKTVNDTKEIIKVNYVDCEPVTRWSTECDSGLLSITNEGNVILAVSDKRKLKEYDSDGVLVHEINVSIIQSYERSVDDVMHAVKLNTGHYLVFYKLTLNDLQGICVIDEEGRIFKSDQNIAYFPTYMTTDSRGSVMVAGHRSGRVIQLDSTLDYKRDLISWPNKHPGLLKIHMDNSAEPRLFASYQTSDTGESVIRVFNVGPNRVQRWMTTIFKHFDKDLPNDDFENRATLAFGRAIRTWTTSNTAVAVDNALQIVLLMVAMLLIPLVANFFKTFGKN